MRYSPSMRLLSLPLVVVFVLPACAHEPAPPASGAPTCPASWAAPPVVDPALTPPGNPLRVVAHAAATGTQNYQCASSSGDGGASFAWTLTGPEATLADCKGAALGRHFASEAGAAAPKWEAQDGSFVIGKKVAASPSKDAGAVPWLLVQTTSSGGTGVLSGVTYIQRTTTAGGVAPGGCDAAHAGTVTKVPYTADYWFLGN